MPDVIDWFGTGSDAGDHSYLSNFYNLSQFFYLGLPYAGLWFPTVEHAYQAAKTVIPEQRIRIRNATSPRSAKSLGRNARLRPDWEQAKLPIMGLLLDRKFTNERLAHKLLETGDAVLIEGNYWHDNEWGDCRCKDRLECQAEGQNLLGLELMRVRGEIALEYAA